MTVKIPEELVKALAPYGAKWFVKVAKPVQGNAKTGKGAVEKGWHQHPYAHDDPELLAWLEEGGNYGILCGHGLHEIDLDDSEMIEKFESKISTFTVQSGGGKGRHYYVRGDLKENGTISKTMADGTLKNFGNIQVINKHVVGPNSVHHTGNRYKILKVALIEHITPEQLEEIFGEDLHWAGKSLAQAEEIAQKENKSIGNQIPMTELIDMKELRELSNGEFQGPHPVHGSTQGQNFTVNTTNNLWHCFRCNSGGGPLMWIAVKQGWLKCHEAKSGALHGEMFTQTVNKARELGFEITQKTIIEEGESFGFDINRYFDAETGNFIPPLLGDDLMAENHYLTHEKSMQIFVYQPKRGIYSPHGEQHIRKKVADILNKHHRKNRVIEVIEYIRNKTMTKVLDTPPYIIAFANCLYNLKTKEKLKFSPNYFILTASPVIYDANADTSIIEKFIKEIVDGNDQLTLQEISGYCFYRSYVIHGAIVLIGDGANGKSTYYAVLVEALGPDNVVSIEPGEFERSPFAVGELYGRAANIYPDLSDKTMMLTGKFKQLTSGENVSGEHKYERKFTFKPYAKQLFACNKLPDAKEDTAAFWRRWTLINFPHQFLPEDPNTDIHILEKLTTPEALSGFVKWALEGLERLLEQKKFTSSKTIEDTRTHYIRSSDPVRAFALDNIVSAPGNTITKQEVFHAFQKYCDEMGLGKLSEQAVTRRLKQHVTGLTDKKARVDGKAVYVWVDIDIKDKRSNLVGTNHIIATTDFSKYNFSEKQENLEQSEHIPKEHTWLDDNREV